MPKFLKAVGTMKGEDADFVVWATMLLTLRKSDICAFDFCVSRLHLHLGKSRGVEAMVLSTTCA